MKQIVITALITLFLVHDMVGQAQTTTRVGGIRTLIQIDENTPLFDKSTGQRISFDQYQQRMKSDPYAYHLEPTYDEYGKPYSYTMRLATPEEKETHRFYDVDLSKRPKVGQPIAPFAMTGLDGKVYRSADLSGNVIVLGFWLSLEKPFWGEKQTEAFGNVIRPYQSETSPIVLGVLSNTEPKVIEYLNTQTLPFMPVPNGHGFHKKYQITSIPAFVVIDKTGKVAAYIEGQDYAKLKQTLDAVTR